MNGKNLIGFFRFRPHRRAAFMSLLLGSLLFGTGKAVPAQETVLRWTFQDKEVLKDWSAQGVIFSRIEKGALKILGQNELQLILPPGLRLRAEENPYLKIRLKLGSGRFLQVFWQSGAASDKLPADSFYPVLDSNFHHYWIKLSDSDQWRGEINLVGLNIVGKKGWIEIESMEFGSFDLAQYLSVQWEEFWLPRTLNLATINSLSSPRLFNRPLISWFNKAAALAMVLGAILYLKGKPSQKVRVIGQVGLVLLALWVLYDARETYSQYQTAREIFHSYVEPPAEKKTFPPLGDFYRFVEFCRRHLPPDSVFELLPRSYWPFDCRLKYFLYPAHFEAGNTRVVYGPRTRKYFIVYNEPDIVCDPASGQLRARAGKVVFAAAGRLVARYDPDSFIYLEEEGRGSR